ncbi:hypothetical protein GCM10007385_36730 [Tateyamaria omphalii]|nr:hypothetical protein GCM10007385_36730 [Tateyamaria omphalii]
MDHESVLLFAAVAPEALCADCLDTDFIAPAPRGVRATTPVKVPIGQRLKTTTAHSKLFQAKGFHRSMSFAKHVTLRDRKGTKADHWSDADSL